MSCSLMLAGLVQLPLASALRAGPGDGSDRLFVLAVDMTKRGREMPAPSPENPSYYFPVYVGYKELGDIVKHFERPPASEHDVRLELATALAKQGYLPATEEHPPTLVLAFEWGTIAPVRLGMGKRRLYVANESEIRAYVLGDSARDIVHGFGGYNQEMSSLTARHFLMVSAFVYQAGSARTPEILLWRAHATTDA